MRLLVEFGDSDRIRNSKTLIRQRAAISMETELLSRADHLWKRDGEIVELLSKADRLWKTDDEAAIRIYKRLLLEFGDTERVRISKTRIWQRAEQGD